MTGKSFQDFIKDSDLDIAEEEEFTTNVKNVSGTKFFQVRRKFINNLLELREKLWARTPVELEGWFETQFFPKAMIALFESLSLGPESSNKKIRIYSRSFSLFNTNFSTGFKTPYTDLSELVEELKKNWQGLLDVEIKELVPPKISKRGHRLLDPTDKEVFISI